MQLRDLKLSDVGKLIVVHHSPEAFTQGRLQHLATETVEERGVCQAPGEGDQVVTGYTVTVNGWTRSTLSPSTEVGLL